MDKFREPPLFKLIIDWFIAKVFVWGLSIKSFEIDFDDWVIGEVLATGSIVLFFDLYFDIFLIELEIGRSASIDALMKKEIALRNVCPSMG